MMMLAIFCRRILDLWYRFNILFPIISQEKSYDLKQSAFGVFQNYKPNIYLASERSSIAQTMCNCVCTLVKAFLRVTFFKPNWADIYGTDWDMVL